MSKNSQHIVKDTKGGWSVKKGGAIKATRHFATQQEAIVKGREIARNQSADLYIHGADGRIRSKDSYGKNSPPQKRKK